MNRPQRKQLIIKESAVSFQQESDATTKFESHLNRKHLFENFVEGKSNQLARAVGQNSLLHQVNQRQTHSFYMVGQV